MDSEIGGEPTTTWKPEFQRLGCIQPISSLQNECFQDAAAMRQSPQPPVGTPSDIAFDEQIKNEKRLEEDCRWDYLLRMQNTMHETFNNPTWIHPHGMTDFDHCLIPEYMEKGFENFKVKIRRQNYTYLHAHPELDGLMSLFMKKIITVQPSNSVKFTTEFFTSRGMDPDEMRRSVNEEMTKLKKFNNPKGWKANSPNWYDNTNALKDVNEVKTLSLGPASQEFVFTPPVTPKSRILKIKKPKTKKNAYCGCKDPARREIAHEKVVPANPQESSHLKQE